MESQDLLKEVKGHVMYLTLNRPERLNAFSPEMIASLKQSLIEAEYDEKIRVIVLKGAGRAFSAGGDVKRMGKRDSLGTYKYLGKLNELILQMHQLEKPIIAAVHGYAAGAGFNLALASDMILSSSDCKFILSFSKVGLISDGGGLYFLPKLVGPYIAKELFFRAEPISAERAYHLGIINRVYEPETFSGEVERFANEIAVGPGIAYGFIKKLTNLSMTSGLAELLEQERITQATVVTTKDHQEGIQAFKEKRQPRFGKK